jgi:hypothetical protein
MAEASSRPLRMDVISLRRMTMGTKNAPGKFDCYANAEPDEPMFVLLGRDAAASVTVRFWVAVRKMLDGTSQEKLDEAIACADALRAWAVNKGKTESVNKCDEMTIAKVIERLEGQKVRRTLRVVLDQLDRGTIDGTSFILVRQIREALDLKLHMFENGCTEWVIAYDADDACDVYRQNIGIAPEDYDGVDEWEQLPGDKVLKFLLDADGNLSDSGTSTQVTVDEACVRFGHGFHASSEF